MAAVDHQVVAVGIAHGEGLLRLDDPVLMHLPQFADTAASGVEQVTIEHLLRMTSGIDYRWVSADNDHPDDAARDYLATPRRRSQARGTPIGGRARTSCHASSRP